MCREDRILVFYRVVVAFPEKWKLKSQKLYGEDGDAHGEAVETNIS